MGTRATDAITERAKKTPTSVPQDKAMCGRIGCAGNNLIYKKEETPNTFLLYEEGENGIAMDELFGHFFGRKRSILSQHAMSVQEEGFNGTESTNIYKPQAADLE